jgi:serine/threonine-protein kinase RsbW
MKDSVVVSVPSHPKYLSVIRDITTGIGKVNDLDNSVIGDIKLAVDEACSNVIRHAYKGDTEKKILLKYKVTKRSFRLTIEDNGIKANIENMKGRDLDDIKPGGLGIHFIKRVFDVFELDEKKKTGNKLILVKYLKER